MGFMKLTYVTGPDKPYDVGREVRPPKAVDDMCMFGNPRGNPAGRKGKAVVMMMMM